MTPAILRATLLLTLLLTATLTQAAQYKTFGDLQVHYVVLNTTDLPADVAEQYGIRRADNRGLINISGRRVNDDGTTSAVALEVEGTVTNLLEQRQTLEFEEVRERDAIYYLESLIFTDRESLRFRLQVTDPATGESHPLEFSKVLWKQ